MVDDVKPGIVCLQETNLNVVTAELMLSMLGVQYANFAYLPAANTCGGIIIVAQQNSLIISDVHLGCYTVTVKVTSAVDDRAEPWWLTSVYGPQEDGAKELFLDELEAIRDTCPGAWLVVGDFNLILDESDKNNARINRRNLRKFREVVNSLELQDLHLHGRSYTWSNERVTPTLVKLDRALVSIQWEEIFHDCLMQALSSDVSDHCPLLLHTNTAYHPKQRFHFEVFWPKLEGYTDMVIQGWSCPAHITDPFQRLDQLFRNLIKELQSWSARKIGNIKMQLLTAREIIFKLDQAQDTRQLSAEEIELRQELKHKCLGLSSLERTIARQRSRVLFIREGDASTKFFHAMARGRHRRKRIVSLKSGDLVTVQHEAMEQMVYDHFSAIFGHPASRSSTVNFTTLGITPTDLSHLDLAFTEQEVWAAIKELPADKAPGPDGFTGAFYQSAWAVIKSDLIAAINAFAEGRGQNLGLLNNAIIILLPKKHDAKEPGDYRPITLVHSFGKLLSKMQSIRVAPQLEKLIAVDAH